MATKQTEFKERAKGLISAVPSVFDGKGEPDLAMMEKVTDWYLNAGVHGLFVLGSQGQGAACTIDQRKAIAETVVKRVNGRVPIIIQVGAVDPYSSMELAAHAKQIGADSIGVVGPYYYSDRSEWEIIEQYKMVDKAAGLPMLLYNNPKYSGYPCPPAMMVKLRDEIPNVFGAKLADGSVPQAMPYRLALSADFNLYLPIEMMLPGMLVGIHGSIASGTPVTVPEAGVALIEAIKAGKYEKAIALQVLLIEHGNRMAPLRSYGRGITLEGLRLRGLAVKEYPRWTTKPMTPEHIKLFQENIKLLLNGLESISGRLAAVAE